MNNLFTHLKNEADRIRLTSVEKQAMRTRLYQVLSPQPIAIKSPYQWFIVPRLLAFYSFVGILIIGSSTAYAAQGSLPGSVLYPIKIHINEQVETVLAVTPQARAEVNAKLAERRIKEVEILATQGALDTTIIAQAEQDFDYHASQVETFAKNSKHKNAKIFSVRVGASLDTLGTALVETSEHGKNEEVKKNSKKFAEHVRARSQRILNLEINDDQEATSTISE